MLILSSFCCHFADNSLYSNVLACTLCHLLCWLHAEDCVGEWMEMCNHIRLHVIVVLWFSKVYRYNPYTLENHNPYTLENHSTADLYYDATTQTLGSVSLPQSLYFTMQLGCIFIHPRVYEISRVPGFCTSCFSFEVWLHHSTNNYIHHQINQA